MEDDHVGVNTVLRGTASCLGCAIFAAVMVGDAISFGWLVWAAVKGEVQWWWPVGLAAATAAVVAIIIWWVNREE